MQRQHVSTETRQSWATPSYLQICLDWTLDLYGLLGLYRIFLIDFYRFVDICKFRSVGRRSNRRRVNALRRVICVGRRGDEMFRLVYGLVPGRRGSVSASLISNRLDLHRHKRPARSRRIRLLGEGRKGRDIGVGRSGCSHRRANSHHHGHPCGRRKVGTLQVSDR